MAKIRFLKTLFILMALFILSFKTFASDPISQAMCRDPLSFRECYGFSKEDCERLADINLQECHLHLPKRPKVTKFGNVGASDVGNWNILLGHCAEKEFIGHNGKNFTGAPNCVQLQAAILENHLADEGIKHSLVEKQEKLIVGSVRFCVSV